MFQRHSRLKDNPSPANRNTHKVLANLELLGSSFQQIRKRQRLQQTVKLK